MFNIYWKLNLFTRELYGILLKTGLANYVGYRPGMVFIYIDNQALIYAISNLSSKSSQYIV